MTVLNLRKVPDEEVHYDLERRTLLKAHLRQIFANESPLKMMKNTVYFT